MKKDKVPENINILPPADYVKKPFSNKVLKFPSHIREEINKLIKSGVSAKDIRTYIQAHYADKVEIPNILTVNKYVQWYKQISDMGQLSLGFDSTGAIEPKDYINRESALKWLLKKIYFRTKRIENIQRRNFNVHYESLLLRYFAEIRNVLKELSDFNEPKEEVQRTVQSRIEKFLEIVKHAVLDVAPEKFEKFVSVLKERLTEEFTQNDSQREINQSNRQDFTKNT